MQSARDLWQELSALGRVYDDDLCFQLNSPQMNARRHHWRDRLVELDKDLARLDELIRESHPKSTPLSLMPPPPRQALQTMILDAPEQWSPGQDLPVHLRVTDGFDGDVLLHYRHTNLLEGDFSQLEMERDGNTYRARVPDAYLTAEWDLLLYASTRLSDAVVQIVPGLWHPDHVMPYRVVEIEQD
jgi:hypothetical protein